MFALSNEDFYLMICFVCALSFVFLYDQALIIIFLESLE
jgi:hypothetical protein